MSPILVGTINLLYSWGRWGQGQHLGLPRRSPMFGERALKTPLYSEANPDPEIQKVDDVVSKIEYDYRKLLIERYQWFWSWKDSTQAHCVSKATYFRRLEQAHWAVHVALGR